MVFACEPGEFVNDNSASWHIEAHRKSLCRKYNFQKTQGKSLLNNFFKNWHHSSVMRCDTCGDQR